MAVTLDLNFSSLIYFTFNCEKRNARTLKNYPHNVFTITGNIQPSRSAVSLRPLFPSTSLTAPQLNLFPTIIRDISTAALSHFAPFYCYYYYYIIHVFPPSSNISIFYKMDLVYFLFLLTYLFLILFGNEKTSPTSRSNVQKHIRLLVLHSFFEW